MSSSDNEVEFVEVQAEEKKKKGGGICKAILRFFGSNIGLFLALRKIISNFVLEKTNYLLF